MQSAAFRILKLLDQIVPKPFLEHIEPIEPVRVGRHRYSPQSVGELFSAGSIICSDRHAMPSFAGTQAEPVGQVARAVLASSLGLSLPVGHIIEACSFALKATMRSSEYPFIGLGI